MSNNGKQGENLFKQIMQNSGYKVQDVSDNSQYWEQDIDFIVTSPTTGITKTFEVKWDSRINKTGNLFLEIANAHSKGGKGWFDFCQADCIAYGDATTKTFYIIPLPQLKERVKKVKPSTVSCGTESIGYIMPLQDVLSILEGVI